MTPKTPFDALMDELSVGWGYCGSVQDGNPVHISDFIPEEGYVTADQFVEWVYLTEGMKADGHAHRKALQRLFVEHMGADVILARCLKSN